MKYSVNNTKAKLNEIEKNFHMHDFPPIFCIEVCTHCNLRCSMCANPYLKRQKGVMDMVLYKKIIDEIANGHEDSKVWLCGYGEPLLEKDLLFKMIKYAKDKGIKETFVNTNGMLLSDSMSDLLINAGLDNIVVGIDGFSKDVMEKCRVGADRDTVYKNVANLKGKSWKNGGGDKYRSTIYSYG